MCAKTSTKKRAKPKTRKLKYLSLKLELSNQKSTQPTKAANNAKPQIKKQLNLFPLHPENLVQDKDLHEDHHVAFLFETATDDTSTTLQGLLDSTTTVSEEDKDPQLSSSLTYTYRAYDEENSLVKTAMRCKQRDASEERWVSYWDVVEKREQEDASSCCSGVATDSVVQYEECKLKSKPLVGLKLDYEEILNAWSDKGPLYIQEDHIHNPPQTVPEIHDPSTKAAIDGWEISWMVPEIGDAKAQEKEGEAKEGWKLGQREASVLRYKEKRQSRLFAKRIRYEVRKLNAEKRPRVKGRFVKRDEDE